VGALPNTLAEMRPVSARRPVISYEFSALNIPPESIPTDTNLFSLTAEPQTDLWRRPPGEDTSTAPVLFRSLKFPFVSAEVSVCADWGLEWDQAGLVLFAGTPPGASEPQTSTTNPPSYPTPRDSKWVKIGLEYNNNVCHVSTTCATAHGADWSITALPSYHSQRTDLRVKFERLGVGLWLYYEDQLLGWKKLREISGFFYGVPDKSVRVGVYASRPANFDGAATPFNSDLVERMDRNLTVEFEDLLIF
jgi:regulation of enolase protein 1 (concanavalin A-like superfamily)